MNNRCLFIIAVFTLVIIQNCTTTEKVATDKAEKKTEAADEELYGELEKLKTVLGYEPGDKTTPEPAKTDQPIEFGTSVARVQEIFPAPDKFGFDPMVNRKVTLLSRPSSGGNFTFFFYEDKLYKIVIISKWSNYTLQYADEDIRKTEAVFIEGNGEPDSVEENEIHKKMVWLKDDMEITLELFNLMTHQGMSRIMSLIYADRNISPLARQYESFDLYRTKEISDH